MHEIRVRNHPFFINTGFKMFNNSNPLLTEKKHSRHDLSLLLLEANKDIKTLYDEIQNQVEINKQMTTHSENLLKTNEELKQVINSQIETIRDYLTHIELLRLGDSLNKARIEKLEYNYFHWFKAFPVFTYLRDLYLFIRIKGDKN